MRWGVVEEYASDIAFFGGKINDTMVALLGAKDSIVGQPIVSESKHDPFYYTMKFFNQVLVKEGFATSHDYSGSSSIGDEPPYYSYEEAVDIAYQALASSWQKDQDLEFLALVMYQERALVVGTPLYVALVGK